MSRKPKVIMCRNCHAPIAKHTKFCTSCGAKNKKPFFKRWWFILFVVILVLVGIDSINKRIKEKFDWNEVDLCDRLPKPKSNVGAIISNNGEHLMLNVEKTSRRNYNAYIKECQSMGYTVESEKDENSYTALDDEGYILHLGYAGERMNIDLEAPQEMGALDWPKSEIAALLPLPKSTVGKVSSDTEKYFKIYVGETSLDAFNTYVDECSKHGFSVEYERGDKIYKAKDGNGNRLSLSYKGNNVMLIEMRKSDGTETNHVSEQSSSNNQEAESGAKSGGSAEATDGVRPEFKKAMDSYEEFMDGYCQFMKKYAESNGSDLTMLAEYSNYMSKYAEVAESFDAWGDKEMNKAETAYYLDVQTRINKKLLEVTE